MWNIQVWGIQKPEGHDEKFKNINYPSRCPVCGEPLDDWKVVRGYVNDETIGHEFRVCLHKRCIRDFTAEHAFEVLSYDPLYGDISFDYQGEIAVEVTKMVYNIIGRRGDFK